MSVRPVTYTYTFNPSLNQLNLSGFPASFDVKRLFSVIDLTAAATGNSVIYAAGQPGLGYTSISGTTLTLMASMAGLQATDTLMILYDDGNEPSAAPTVQMAISGNLVSSTHRLPVEIDAQTAGLAQDSTVQAVATGVGTIGSSPPSLPGGSSGIIGIIRWLGSLLSGTLIVGGAAAGGTAPSGNPVLAAGSDGTNVRTLLTDGYGFLMTANGSKTTLNITTGTAVKASAGRACRVAVVVAGSAAGSVNDCLVPGSATPSNAVASIPNTVGVYTVDMPCSTGICVVPGTGQTLAISYI